MTARAIRLGAYASIAGQEQWVTIRGADTRNPLLLILGGPGGALSALAPFFAPWEERFTLVQWDQPGAGSTHARHGDVGLGAYTLERLARDAVAVTEHATRRLGADKLILLGVSGGSAVGLMVAAERPDLLHAYVGTGQIVCWRRQQALGYERVLADARRDGNAEVVAALEHIGPPPWAALEDEIVASKHLGALTAAEGAALASLDPAVLAAMQAPPPGADYVADGVAIGDQRPQATAMYARLREALGAFDAWRLGPRFEVPLFFLQGEQDAMTATVEVERFVRDVDSPRAELLVVPESGHSAFFRRDVFLQLLEERVLGALELPAVTPSIGHA